jgi:hypothetical protein
MRHPPSFCEERPRAGPERFDERVDASLLEEKLLAGDKRKDEHALRKEAYRRKQERYPLARHGPDRVESCLHWQFVRHGERDVRPM